MSNHEDETKRYDVTPILESRYFILPASAALVGVFIGAVRGSRLASLRFLAENAHRPPKTIRGWYLYNKTKNYKRMAAGLLSGGKEGVKLGVTALVWVGIEDGLGRCGAGFDDLKEVGAGVGTAGAFSIVYRLRWRTASRALLLGSIIGGGMGFLRWAREYLKRARGDFI
ncbi:uncharacterized protein F5147DRAFT_667676 [Suillus discolor]|uniref:Uncharacterized protein n=1 Tax=Suillus discolor TaxID=1912936 RepID=A0A9P7FKQ3_9AGAM|nr:uncharacterized protein F5147DRAFT_667676 [Suillus discolor]KAG2118970.1 hypothetical protein F5147DRAFT_667676 [Suillus discolor]